MAYHLQFYGHTWAGHKGVYEYVLDHPVQSDDQALKEAGDFQSVIDWRLVKVTPTLKREGNTYSKIVDCLTIRGFRSGKMNPRRFFKLANGY